MNFATAIREDMTHTYTENGARAKNTSGDACLDLFSTGGSLRDSDLSRKQRLLMDAFNEDSLTATRILFYLRDVRGGLGERDTFRQMITHLANKHPDVISKNIWAIPFYGRFDDLYALLSTPCEDDMWKFMRAQFENDWDGYLNDEPISLMAKWIRCGNESSKKSRARGILTATKLGFTVYEFKRKIARLRKYLDVVESKMSTNRWDEINYSHVPSRAGMLYRNAFNKHDALRYQEFISKVSKGEAKINTSNIYPYDIVSKVWRSMLDEDSRYYFDIEPKEVDTTEHDALCAMWDNLPNYVPNDSNAIVIADTSGSMMCSGGRPFYTAVALAVYFAQRNTGAYHNLWMSFSHKPKFHSIKGDDIFEVIKNFDSSDWGLNTDMQAAFTKVLDVAIENDVPADQMVKSLIVISDMEIDAGCGTSWSFYDDMKQKYAEHGYEIPNVVFWNVNSRHDVFHADKSRKGVQLVSGQAPSTFTSLMSSIGLTPMEFMYKVINSERYENIWID